MDLTKVENVKKIQSDMRAVFESPAGQEVMKFLEVQCGWYQSVFNPVDRDLSLINDGKRQVIATIKTMLNFNAEQIAEMVKRKQNG